MSLGEGAGQASGALTRLRGETASRVDGERQGVPRQLCAVGAASAWLRFRTRAAVSAPALACESLRLPGGACSWSFPRNLGENRCPDPRPRDSDPVGLGDPASTFESRCPPHPPGHEPRDLRSPHPPEWGQGWPRPLLPELRPAGSSPSRASVLPRPGRSTWPLCLTRRGGWGRGALPGAGLILSLRCQVPPQPLTPPCALL